MNRHKRYPPEVRERAVRLVLEHQEDYNSQWAALTSIAGKIGCTAETLENQQIMNTLISFLCRLITKRRPSRAIKKDYPDYDPFSHRRDKKQTCFLHNNRKPDNPSHVHDPPWDSISIILTGGYTEQRLQHIDLDSAISPWPNPRMTTHVNGRPLAVAVAAVSGAIERISRSQALQCMCS